MEIKNRPTSKNALSSNSNAEKQLRDVSSLYEKQFLREMVKQMRATVSESSFMPSGFAEKYFREQLDQQYVESWGDQGGIGLGQMIYEQLISKYGAMLGIKTPEAKPGGPLPINQRDQWRPQIEPRNKSIIFTKETKEVKDVKDVKDVREVRESNRTKENKDLTSDSVISMDLQSNSNHSMVPVHQGPVILETPWAGRWLGSFELEKGLKVAKIQHEGFQSVVASQFFPAHLKIGDILKSGEAIGTLSPEAQQIHWKLIKSNDDTP